MKREVMTRREWRQYYASMDKPPIAAIFIGEIAAYLFGGAVFLLMLALW